MHLQDFCSGSYNVTSRDSAAIVFPSFKVAVNCCTMRLSVWPHQSVNRTMPGTAPHYPSAEQIEGKFQPIVMENKQRVRGGNGRQNRTLLSGTQVTLPPALCSAENTAALQRGIY